MRHLGVRTSAYVDGRLTGRSLARAEAHLRVCDQCVRQVAAERALQLRLRGIGDAEPPLDLPARSLRTAPPAGPRPRGLAHRLTDRAALPGWRRRVAGRVAAGAGLAGLATAGVLLMGGLPAASPDLLRDPTGGAAFRATVQASVSDSTEATVAGLRDHGWALPAELPADLHISAATLHEVEGVELLEVEVVGPAGAVRLLQVHGALDAADLPADAELVQCGGVAAVLTGEPATRARVAALLPAAPVDSSMAGRFDRGVQAIVSLLREVSP